MMQTKWLIALLCLIVTYSEGCSAEDKAMTDSTESLYGLNVAFKDDQNKNVPFSEWKGKWVIASMVYLSCKASCPLTMQKLKAIERTLKESKKTAEFVVTSFDAENDTPADLNKFKQGYNLDNHWHFLTGTKESVRTLSLLLGFSYKKIDGTTEFNHSNRVLLLDPNGEVRTTLDRLSAEHAELVDLVK